MANNIVSKLLLDDKDYNAKLEKAKKSTDGYQKNVESLGKSVGGNIVKAFGSAAAALGLAGGAVSTFNKFVNSTNDSTDKWEASLRAVKTSVDTFFSSLRTGDFTAFSTGLSGIIAKARTAAGALDALGNAQISFQYFDAANQADFQEALVQIKDTELSFGSRQNAVNTAESILGDQREITDQLRKKVISAVQSLASENNLLDSTSISLENISRVMRLDISESGEDEKKRLQKEYEKYLSEIKKVKPVAATTVGSTTQSGMYISSRIEDPADRTRYNQEVTAISEKYKDAVLYNSILKVDSDDWLKNMTNLVITAENADRVFASMEKSLIRAKKMTVSIKDEMSLFPTITPNTGTMAGLDTAKNVVAKGNKAPTFIETPEVIKQSGDSLQLITNNAGEASEAVGGLASIMGSLGSVMDKNGESWMSWISNVLQAVATAIPAIEALAVAERTKASASAEAAAAGGASAVASIPIVGPIMAVAAVSSIIAAFSSIPKFAAGGVVPGGSFYGDNVIARVNSGEMVLNKEQQTILSNRLNDNISGKVEFRIKDSQLVGILDSYYQRNNRRA